MFWTLVFQRLKLTEELEKELQETRATQDKEQRLRVVSLHSVSFSSASFTLSGQPTFCVFLLCLFHPQWSVYTLCLSPLPLSLSVVSLHTVSFSFYLFHSQWSVYTLCLFPSTSFTPSGQSTHCVFFLLPLSLSVVSLHTVSFSFYLFHPQWSVYTLCLFPSTSFTLSGQSTHCVFFLLPLSLPVVSLHTVSFSFYLFHPEWSVYILHLSPLPLSPSKATQSDQPTFWVILLCFFHPQHF